MLTAKAVRLENKNADQSISALNSVSLFVLRKTFTTVLERCSADKASNVQASDSDEADITSKGSESGVLYRKYQIPDRKIHCKTGRQDITRGGACGSI